MGNRNAMRGTQMVASLVVLLALVTGCRAPAPVAPKEVEMQSYDGGAAGLASEIARRLGGIATGRQKLVVHIEQFGDSLLESETRTALEKALGRDERIVLSRLADGVSVPESRPAGGGYSEAIGMRIPTPAPDVTVQLTATAGGIEVYAVLHTGPARSETLFRLPAPQ